MICLQCNTNLVSRSGKFCSLSCSAKYGGERSRRAARQRYADNPKRCHYCEDVIAYEDRKVKLKFCSQSCSGRAANERMTVESRRKQGESLRIFNEKNPRPKKEKPAPKNRAKKTDKFPFTKVSAYVCKETGKTFYSRYWRKYCNDAAKVNRLVYRQHCSFGFSPYQYTDMEGYDLLLTHGIYHPVSNPTGVSRDHKYSVADGWKNSVDPEIMKHRFNCRLVLHSDNNKKNTCSSISLSELLEKVEARVGLEPTMRYG